VGGLWGTMLVLTLVEPLNNRPQKPNNKPVEKSVGGYLTDSCSVVISVSNSGSFLRSSSTFLIEWMTVE